MSATMVRQEMPEFEMEAYDAKNRSLQNSFQGRL